MSWLTPDLLWLAAAAFAAGLVRGFSGFGTAMVYLPVAGQVLPPFEAITTLIVMDLVGPLPSVPRALRDGHPRDVMRLGAGLVLGVPVGLAMLLIVAPEVFRYAVSLISLLLLVCLIGGLRYRGLLSRSLMFVTGGLGGLLAGVAGMAGPPVILLYMSSAARASVVRANVNLFLILSDLVLIAVMALYGQLVPEAIVIGVILIVPYLLANLAGAAIFRPERENAYRAVAYVVIAGSAISGLPLWD